MSAGKRKSLSPAFLAETWRPGQSGNPGGHSGLYGEAVKLARGLSLRAVQRLGELMESEDERISLVACTSLLDRAFGKPKPAVEEKDETDARIASMSREERLAFLQELLEPMRRYLPPGEDAGPTVDRSGPDRAGRRDCRYFLSRSGGASARVVAPGIVTRAMGAAPGSGWLPSAGLPAVTRTCQSGPACGPVLACLAVDDWSGILARRQILPHRLEQPVQKRQPLLAAHARDPRICVILFLHGRLRLAEGPIEE